MTEIFYYLIFAFAGAFLVGLVICNHAVAAFSVREIDPKSQRQVAVGVALLLVMTISSIGIIAFSGRWLMMHNGNSTMRVLAMFAGGIYALVKGLKIIKRRNQARKNGG